jgi:hypothetical protein
MRQLHPDVAEADDGNLFLTRGRHDVFAHATGQAPIRDEVLENFRLNTASRRQSCQRLGAEYRHVILPDKQTVLRDRLPDMGIQGLGVAFAERADDPAVLYLADPLRQLSAEQEVFLLLDTHMTDLGSALASAMIVDSLWPGLGTSHLDTLARCVRRPVEYSGDLGSKIDPPRTAMQHKLVLEWPVRRFSNNFLAGNDGIMDVHVSQRAVTENRLLLFGDSFGRHCLAALSLFFREILFIRTRFFHPEIVAQAEPDVVLTQNVERYLISTPNDVLRPNVLLYPELAGRPHDPPVEFALALDAFLAHGFDPGRMARVLEA